jgi:hypothetical protein
VNVIALYRGQITGGTLIEPGTTFVCSDNDFAPLTSGPIGEREGWMQPATPTDWSHGQAVLAARAALPVNPGLWPPGWTPVPMRTPWT